MLELMARNKLAADGHPSATVKMLSLRRFNFKNKEKMIEDLVE